ncbi:MAG TPA: glycoside hydrolase domain-containing protein [Streptosporangiaceae bacterium]|nr:glycoside hydrolase domain-containing protein [Streptosporangiaceae bacterium]
MSYRSSRPARALAAGCLLTAGALLAGTAGADAASAAATAGSPALAAAATAGPAARPWQTVTYRGIRLKVPASWPVISLTRHPDACPRLDVHAVYLGTPGPDPSCPAGLQGKTTAVALTPVSPAGPDLRQATRPARIGGRPAQTNANAAITHTIIDILPSAGVEVSLSYGRSPALARSIQSTITITGRAAAAPAGPEAITPAAIKPAAPQAGVVKGPGFDTCAAPSAATMKHWLASPYRSVGIYIGGVNRACSQASLTPAWIRAIQAQGWHYFPFYVGLQAPCIAASGNARISPARAAAQGRAAASDAVAQAADLGIPAGTPIIFDMEAYRGGCTGTVTTFLSAWDSQLHARGYVAGIYESFSNISDLVSAAGQMTEPDIIHYADWDGHATTSSSYMPSGMWTSHQRIHQYKGGHNETYGGTTVNIDNDQLDVTLSGTPPGGGTGGSQLRPAFRIAVALNANTTAEWFARAANGTIRHNYQHPVGTTSWSATRAVGNSPGNLAGNPAVTANPDGSLTLFTRTRSGTITHAWQQDGAPNDWQWGGAVGGGQPPAGATGSPGAIRMPGGAVAVFAGTRGGSLAWTRQRSPGSNSSWTAWAGLGGSCASTPVPFVVSGRKMAVFCRTAGGRLAVREQSQGTWGGWTTISGGPGRLTGMPAVVAGDNGQAEVFARASSGQLAYAWQPAGGAGWSWGSSPAGSTKIKNSPTAVPWPGGGTAVMAQQRDGQLGYAVQEGSGAAGWGTWMPLSSHMLGSPTAWVNAGGQPEVAILTSQRKIAVSVFADSQWSAWTRLGGGY